MNKRSEIETNPERRKNFLSGCKLKSIKRTPKLGESNARAMYERIGKIKASWMACDGTRSLVKNPAVEGVSFSDCHAQG